MSGDDSSNYAVAHIPGGKGVNDLTVKAMPIVSSVYRLITSNGIRILTSNDERMNGV